MENVVLCFNAYNYSRLIIGKNAYQDYLSCKDNVEKLNTKNPNLHRTLEANGFIVTDENDEQKKYLSSVQERKFSKDVYHIIVNPTMDCNFLPACPKPCSQKLLEKGENLPCILNKKYGKENYIIEDFYNSLIESNNEK